jgi:hypothetical protein
MSSEVREKGKRWFQSAALSLCGNMSNWDSDQIISAQCERVGNHKPICAIPDRTDYPSLYTKTRYNLLARVPVFFRTVEVF